MRMHVQQTYTHIIDDLTEKVNMHAHRCECTRVCEMVRVQESVSVLVVAQTHMDTVCW